MKKNENGRSMIEMIIVLALIGVLSIGGIKAYKSAQDKNEANKIHELVSTASLNGLTKMKTLPHTGEHNVWKVMGKDQSEYKCVNSLRANSNGSVVITFNASCTKIKKMLTSQWGRHWNAGSDTYTPPRDDE